MTGAGELPPDRPPCLHCLQKPAAVGKRRLCAACYYQPGVKEQYPSMRPGQFKASPASALTGAGELPPSPTQALPGTPEKAAVIEDRAFHGWQLVHPGDAAWDLT